jgi:hypothetical protein
MALRLFRILIILAAVMGADGVMLAAASAHQADATRLAAASSMLLFHASAVLAAVALAERGVIDAICRPQPVPDGSTDRRHAADFGLAAPGGGRGVAATGVRRSSHP